MNTYHVMYTDKNGKFVSCDIKFSSLASCEEWLRNQGAIKWEIGISSDHDGDEFDNDWRDGHPMDFGDN